MLGKSIKANLDAKVNASNLAAQRAQNYTLRTMPLDTRNYVYAMGQGMGYQPSEITQKLLKNESLAEMAADKGLKLEDVTPLYRPTRATLSRMQQRNA
ncbi:MAG: hypothetical protein GWN62_34780, partial [Aliifodinibius sp.]|nr:hypothetical protein [Fodinibius sp.]